MRTLAAVGIAAFALSLLRGQSTPAPLPETLTAPAKPLKLNPAQQAALLTGTRGADWLYRAHSAKGRFVAGYVPALKQEVEGSYFLRQAAATSALGRAARVLGNDKYAARAAQAVLSLLDDTSADLDDPMCLVVHLPGDPLYKLGMAGALVSAICDLPSPQKDVLDKADLLCKTIAKHFDASGGLKPQEGATPEAEAVCPGLALMGVMKSHKHRPAAWKTELVKKALPWCKEWFAKNRVAEFVPSIACAFAECHLATKDKACGDFVLELGEFAVKLQYSQAASGRIAWFGGFMACGKSGAVESMPTADGAGLACALAEACRSARELGDAARHAQFAEAGEKATQFLASLQYTDAGTQHFAAWFRPKVVGAFHASPSDGNLRIDHTAWAVSACLGHVEQAR